MKVLLNFENKFIHGKFIKTKQALLIIPTITEHNIKTRA